MHSFNHLCYNDNVGHTYMFNTVTVPLVRNYDGECSEGRSSLSRRGVLPSGEWIVINLFVANCCHLANRVVHENPRFGNVNVNKVDIFTESY